MIDTSPGQVFGPYQIVKRLTESPIQRFARFQVVSLCCDEDLVRSYEALNDNRCKGRTLCSRCSKVAMGRAKRREHLTCFAHLALDSQAVIPATAWPRPASLTGVQA